MSTEIDVQLLRTLHRILQQQTDLNDRLRRGPARIQVAKQGELAFETTLQETRGQLRETRLGADRKQLQLAEREARIADLQAKRNACESNREFQLLTDQIAADEQANSVQSDEILELLEKIDALELAVGEAEENLVRGQAETARIRDTAESEVAVLQKDLDLVNQELAEAESKLPGDIRVMYRRMVESVGEDALSAVADNSCGHCYTNLTTQVISDLMMKRVVFCKSCGSLLYLPENAAV